MDGKTLENKLILIAKDALARAEECDEKIPLTNDGVFLFSKNYALKHKEEFERFKFFDFTQEDFWILYQFKPYRMPDYEELLMFMLKHLCR